ncbi:unnamed protein product [Phytomonas sp. Hart1]|nr:unnamed protein product [Phytomonas sp. Hart1]|eukprot:CCW71721.1 unnamed protein product [Phytomonas sp. isolate Hart1]
MISEPNVDALKAEALALNEKRGELQRQVQEALDFLDSTPAGRSGLLVDPEGFPRDDCDLYAVSRARNVVSCGRNDLRAVEERLYVILGDLHEATKVEAAARMAADDPGLLASRAEGKELERRLAEACKIGSMPGIFHVISVEGGCPAAEGGLRPQDTILQFGELNAETIQGRDEEGRGLRALAEITQEWEGRLLSVWVRSEDEAEPREIFVVPQRWSGTGLLGCTLSPF